MSQSSNLSPVLISVMESFPLVPPAKRQGAKANVLQPTTSLLAARSAGKQAASDQSHVAQSSTDQYLSYHSYVAALELRVEKLERRLKFAKSRKASMALHDVDAPLAHSDDRKGSMANIHAAIYRKAARQRENSDVNALVSDFGFLYECIAPCRVEPL